MRYKALVLGWIEEEESCSRPSQRGGQGFIYILLYQTMLILTNAFYLVFNLSIFLVVLKSRAIVSVLQLVLRNPLIHITSALCCYTCDTCLWSTTSTWSQWLALFSSAVHEPVSPGVGSKYEEMTRLYIQDLKPAFNVNISSEKLMFY